MKDLLSRLALPLTGFVAFLLLYAIWYGLNLPTDQEMLPVVRGYFDRYGLIVLFVSAFLEGLLLLGVYYPGSVVIFLGVILTIGHPAQAVMAVAVITLALWLSYLSDYLLGKYGWYRLLARLGLEQEVHRMGLRLDKFFTATFFFGYFGPNFAALVSTASGVLQVPLSKFIVYSTLSVIVWNVFWGLFVYILGERALDLLGFRAFLLIALGWIIVQTVLYIKEKRASPALPA